MVVRGHVGLFFPSLSIWGFSLLLFTAEEVFYLLYCFLSVQ